MKKIHSMLDELEKIGSYNNEVLNVDVSKEYVKGFHSEFILAYGAGESITEVDFSNSDTVRYTVPQRGIYNLNIIKNNG